MDNRYDNNSHINKNQDQNFGPDFNVNKNNHNNYKIVYANSNNFINSTNNLNKHNRKDNNEFYSKNNKNKVNNSKKIKFISILFVILILLLIVFIYRVFSNNKNIKPSNLGQNQFNNTLAQPKETKNTNIPENIIPSPTPKPDVFPSDITVDGINIGNKTLNDAIKSVKNNFDQKLNNFNINITYNGSNVFSINGNTLNLKSNYEELIKNIWNNKLNLDDTSYNTSISNLDFSIVDANLNQIKDYANYSAQDAKLVDFNPDNSYPFTFQNEVYGRQIDIETARNEIKNLIDNLQSGSVELKETKVNPSVTLEELKKNYKLLSKSRTPISRESTEQRTDNIRLAFSKYNGMKIAPGKRFSFNSIVGPRTLEAGFFEAVEYAYGEIVYGYGGGVCQASTTTYLSALKSGLKIKKRVQHSREVNYTEPGLDATVYLTSNRNIDFIFENNTGKDIYLTAHVIKESKNKYIAEVAIYGYMDENIKYDVKTAKVEELPAPTEVEYITDKEGKYVQYSDQEYVYQKAKDGFVIETYRIKYDNGKEVDREKISTDTYKPRAKKVYVGNQIR